MIHLYAFVDGAAEWPGVVGLDGRPVEARDVEGLVAATSVLSGEQADGLESRALAHGRVVEALAQVADAVLPVRFGEAFAGEQALASATRPHAVELRAQLEHVRGCAEVGVEIRETRRRPDRASAVSGTDYLLARRADDEHARTAIADVHGPLLALARAHRDARVAAPTLHRAAYLVERSDVEAAAAVVARFAAAHPELAVVCTGPWAPYSFARAA